MARRSCSTWMSRRRSWTTSAMHCTASEATGLTPPTPAGGPLCMVCAIRIALFQRSMHACQTRPGHWTGAGRHHESVLLSIDVRVACVMSCSCLCFRLCLMMRMLTLMTRHKHKTSNRCMHFASLRAQRCPRPPCAGFAIEVINTNHVKCICRRSQGPGSILRFL